MEQDIWAKIVQIIRTSKVTPTSNGYWWKVATNTAIDIYHTRKNDWRGAIELTDDLADGAEGGAPSMAEASGTQTIEDRLDRLRGVLDKLPPETSKEIKQYWELLLKDQPPEDVAAPLVISKETKHRALQLLRRVAVGMSLLEQEAAAQRCNATGPLGDELREAAQTFVESPQGRDQLAKELAKSRQMPLSEARRSAGRLFQVIHSIMFWDRIGRIATLLGLYRREVWDVDAAGGTPSTENPRRLARVRDALTSCELDESFSIRMYRVYQYLAMGNVGMDDANKNFTSKLDSRTRVEIYDNIRRGHLPLVEIIENQLGFE